MVEAARIHPLAGKLHAGNGVSIEPAGEKTRVSLRAREKSVAAASKAIGVKLPVRPKTSAVAKGVVAMWIGPDEWMLLADGDAMLARLKALGNATCSAVDVSHRNTAIVVSGSKAGLALASGCPQDLSLSAFPVGACSRTILGKSEIILYRAAEDSFHVECWRSFSDYVWKYLVDAARSA
ncbi:MAG: sarcosine oxidase subunit gamma [Rhizobiaceae bacterium]